MNHNIFKSIIKDNAPYFIVNMLLKTKDILKSRIYGFRMPPLGTDWVGYEALIKFIKNNHILSIEGDLVEIGTFLGGGAYKLSKYLEKAGSSKRIYVIDVFDPEFDLTVSVEEKSMETYYLNRLKRFGGKTQYEIFQDVTNKCENIIAIKEDTKNVKIPINNICFGFIDGNHDPEYVKNDFNLLWKILSPGGCIAFHDYGGDLPQTTAAIDDILNMHSNEICKKYHYDLILFVIKKKH